MKTSKKVGSRASVVNELFELPVATQAVLAHPYGRLAGDDRNALGVGECRFPDLAVYLHTLLIFLSFRAVVLQCTQ